MIRKRAQMRIRAEQIAAFEPAVRKGYETETLEHLKQDFPRAVRGIEDARLRQFIARGIERAGRYGFQARGPVRTFIDFQVLLGHEFDEDPSLFWVADILRDREGLEEMEQARRLELHVTTYLDLVYGSDGEHVSQGLEHIAKADPLQELTMVGRAFDAHALPWLQALHPRKCAYAGPRALANLIDRARQASLHSGLPGVEGPPLVLGLMFAFGAGVVTDPLFPWVAGSLEPGGEPQARLERLAGRAQAYFRQALESRNRG
jgi:hypothetical protein